MTADVPAIAALWHEAWHDGHAAHVPSALLAYREPRHFHVLAAEQLTRLTLALWNGELAGFVGVEHDELERLFVARAARSCGVFDALLAHGERLIALRHARGYLIVLEANARARRFYARHGWADMGPHAEQAPISGGCIEVRSRRYEKTLR